MAVNAYVLVKTESGQTKEVFSKLSRVSNIVSAYAVTGQYDAVVFVEAGDFQSLGELVISKIRTIPGVAGTETLFAIAKL
jgi:DNA-binding Lrp family transcriptional regulator